LSARRLSFRSLRTAIKTARKRESNFLPYASLLRNFLEEIIDFFLSALLIHIVESNEKHPPSPLL